eukprot:CAMPEP_0198310684 /NCGR_PEP_ID=MMETSP1450-20131203/2670_1 /TAXON_ID=753684 ORGANISM="Madagascaria erythrocladiodes, Strain CCMP3234" /NCGR_SAMPLE_ID=MMETSP1450 /ASSEMBLY_ACC=CAM_ASM_001115 /LENGTH=115 /DNA_ID=CAMNT_0044013527 /DNA_START=63 /DNA_END=411 /DNA_ORIENTATION=+
MAYYRLSNAAAVIAAVLVFAVGSIEASPTAHSVDAAMKKGLTTAQQNKPVGAGLLELDYTTGSGNEVVDWGCPDDGIATARVLTVVAWLLVEYARTEHLSALPGRAPVAASTKDN